MRGQLDRIDSRCGHHAGYQYTEYITTLTPSSASARAQARPRPLLAPLTSAVRPSMPRFISRVQYGLVAD